MDLAAAHKTNERARHFTIAGMFACFLLAGGILAVSLVVAKASLPAWAANQSAN